MPTSVVDLLLDYEASGPAHFLFNIQAAFCSSQRVLDEQLIVTPGIKVRCFSDASSGNRFFRLDAPAGPLSVRYHARVELSGAPAPAQLDETPITQLPDEVLHYLMPSRYCESDSLSRAAQQLFGALAPGIERVRAVERWIFNAIAYQLGSSQSTTTAQDVFVRRVGVCRDFAHLGVTLCRALNIPARLVVGYVHFQEPPQDFHALFEAWLGGRWVLFDPTQLAPVERLVRIGTGRDAKDVAFSTIFGNVIMLRKDVSVTEDGDAAATATAANPPGGSPATQSPLLVPPLAPPQSPQPVPPAQSLPASPGS